jgi:hypothetical protein
MDLSLEAKAVSLFLQGKSRDEIAGILGVDVEKVDVIISSVLSQSGDDAGDIKFAGFDKELMNIYEVQKKRVMRYISLERQMRMPITDTKDNLLLLLKILEALWRIKGGKVSVDALRNELFGGGGVEG